MNRKALSLLIVVVMLLAVVPAGGGFASATASTAEENTSKAVGFSTTKTNMPGDIDFLTHHRTGLKWVPLSKYERITGTKFQVLNAKAFREALQNAPFYPRLNTVPTGSNELGSSLMSTNLNDLPKSVVNTVYLPPIGDQGHIGSCTAWSSTYYVWTYMINWWRNNPFPSSPDVIMNPTFTYNLINGGVDKGSNPYDAMNLISTIGAVSESDFPVYSYPPKSVIQAYHQGNPRPYYKWKAYAISVWPNLTQWMIAPHNSGNDYMWLASELGVNIPGNWYVIDLTNETQWKYLKALLAKGYIVQYAYRVTLPFAAVNIFSSADEILYYLDYWATYIANATNNQTYYDWVNQTYLSNETFVQGLKNTFMRYTVTTAFYEFTKETGWWKVWHDYLAVKYNYTGLTFYRSGHAVTIVGYDDRVKTPDGYGVIKIANSWGQDWGDNGYFYVSYKDIRFGEESFQMAWVYVPKAANYTPQMMAVVGIKHPIRGETFDGIVVYNGSNKYFQILSLRNAGIPLGFDLGNYSDYIPFMDFVNNYLFINSSYLPNIVNASNITQVEDYISSLVNYYAQYLIQLYKQKYNETIPYDTAVERVLSHLRIFLGSDNDYPQVHPYPDSPMAFDITWLLDEVGGIIKNSNTAPRYVTFFVNASDGVRDYITGSLYNFTLLTNINGHYLPLASINGTVQIPDGGTIQVPLTVPVVQYGYLTPANNTSIDFGNFNVDVLSIVPLKGARVIIGGKSYQLSAEEGGYYYYATAIAQKLNLPAGTYTYKVVVTYPNGKDVALPPRTVHIRGPLVNIVSPEPTVYNTSLVPVKVKIVDDNNASVTNVTATLNGKDVNLTYNATTGLYTAELNLTNGEYTLTVTAVDEKNATGKAIVNFVVYTEASVVEVPVSNETNLTVGVIGGNANVTAENNTIVANISTSNGTVTVEVPIVNNVPSVVVNTTAVESVIKGEENATLVAGWNATVKVEKPKVTPVSTEKGKKLYSVTIRANVTLGENGVAVVALRDINISKIYVWKNGQKIQLTTNRSNALGYYYKDGNIIFVVLKQDPVIEADGYFEVPIQVGRSHGVSIAALNFLGYRWYNMYKEQFNELYKKALEMNVSNETLELARQYNETAAEYYQKALELSNGNIILHLANVKIFAPLRKAYLNEMKAVKILKEALEKLEVQGS